MISCKIEFVLLLQNLLQKLSVCSMSIVGFGLGVFSGGFAGGCSGRASLAYREMHGEIIFAEEEDTVTKVGIAAGAGLGGFVGAVAGMPDKSTDIPVKTEPKK